MRIRTLLALIAFSVTGPIVALAQEHFTQGPVWEVSFYRVHDDQFDAYMKYIRATVLPQDEEAKKQGLILDHRTYLATPEGPNDWNVAFATLHKNGADAMDYSKDREDKFKAIAEKHYKTADEDKQREVGKPRLQMRTYLGTKLMREVTLKPMSAAK